MFSTDEKRQLEQLHARRIVRWAIAVSVLLHGALWAVSPFIQGPPAEGETIFEVTLSPEPTKAPVKIARRLAKQPRPTVQPKLFTRPTKKQTTKKTEKSTKTPRRVATLPNTKPQRQSNSAAQSTPQPAGVPTFNPLRSLGNQRTPVSNNVGAPLKNVSPSRNFGGNVPSAAPSKQPHENEIATLPTGEGPPLTGQPRGGQKRGQDTQIYLPDNGNASNALPSNPNSQPRPGGLPSDSGRPTNSNAAPSGGSIARQPIKGNLQPSFQPDTPRPTPRREEASDTSATGNNAPRQTRIARRPKGDALELFPTPTPKPAPKEIPKPEPEPEPERELFRPAKVRSAPKPAYPADAKAKNQEGMVVVRLQISEEGRVTDASIVTSSGVSSLDEASLRGVRRWTYEPARRGQTTVATSLTARLRWRLTD